MPETESNGRQDPSDGAASVGPAQPLLRTIGIEKWFGHLRALDDVSVDIHQGETIGLVGDNGAGKSTLVKILAGVYQPSAGEIQMRGNTVTIPNPNAARRLGIETVYQDLALIDRFTVAENFFLGREVVTTGPFWPLGFMRQRAMREASNAALDNLHVRIPKTRGLMVSKLSGGQRQAIALARGAFWGKSVLLLDEPTAALGVAESREVLGLIERMTEHGLAMIVVTHNLEHLWSICSRIVVLRRGRKVADVAKTDTTPHDIVSFITGASAYQ